MSLLGRLLRMGATLGVIALLSLLVFEVLLRIYNPIDLPMRGTNLFLPVGKRVIFENPNQPSKLDAEIVVSYNSLGFRGPDPLPAQDEPFTIFTVGGSTTHSARQSDGSDWPNRLGRELARTFENTWLNNAGLEGHSTFGHRLLLEQVLLDERPDMILFLIGLNDIARAEERLWDVMQKPEEQSIIERAVAASEVLSTGLVLWRVNRAHRRGLRHFEFELGDLPKVDLAQEDRPATLREHREVYRDAYRERVRTLFRLCKDNGIEPVLVTQPALFGDGIDPRTGIEIGNVDWGQASASLGWEILSVYNDAAMEVAREEEVFVIDLGNTMPKNSSFFYDWVHFTADGSKTVAEIIAPPLISHLRSHPEVRLRAN